MCAVCCCNRERDPVRARYTRTHRDTGYDADEQQDTARYGAGHTPPGGGRSLAIYTREIVVAGVESGGGAGRRGGEEHLGV